jgi:hypothetical protein
MAGGQLVDFFILCSLCKTSLFLCSDALGWLCLQELII